MKRVVKVLLPAPLLALSGCPEPLKDAQVLEEPRVLGVRVATPADRASLEPGQSALADVLVAGPQGTLDARLAYSFCEAASSDRGVPYCEAAPFAEASVELNGAPILIDVPAAIPAGDRLALLGVACLQGEPLLGAAPLDWSCSADELPLRLSFDARASAPDFVNQNPDLSGLSVSVAGTVVPLEDVRTPASCEAGAVTVAARTSHAVQIVLGESAREAGESLQISHFSTSGLFERQYSFVEPDQAPVTSLRWRAPAAGSAIKQYVVVRDGRGGVGWASVSLCAL